MWMYRRPTAFVGLMYSSAFIVTASAENISSILLEHPKDVLFVLFVCLLSFHFTLIVYLPTSTKKATDDKSPTALISSVASFLRPNSARNFGEITGRKSFAPCALTGCSLMSRAIVVLTAESACDTVPARTRPPLV